MLIRIFDPFPIPVRKSITGHVVPAVFAGIVGVRKTNIITRIELRTIFFEIITWAPKSTGRRHRLRWAGAAARARVAELRDRGQLPLAVLPGARGEHELHVPRSGGEDLIAGGCEARLVVVEIDVARRLDRVHYRERRRGERTQLREEVGRILHARACAVFLPFVRLKRERSHAIAGRAPAGAVPTTGVVMIVA